MKQMLDETQTKLADRDVSASVVSEPPKAASQRSKNMGLPLAVGDPIGYMFDAQATQHMMFLAANQRIHELYWNATAGWQYHDPTGDNNAPVASGKPAGYVFAAQGTQHVMYRGYGDHIYQVQWVAATWSHSDLTTASNAPKTIGDPAAYVFDAQGTQHVMSRAADNHIHELWCDSSGWHHHDPTGDNGAPDAAGDPAAYVFPAQGTQHVMYLGKDKHIHELYWSNGSWGHTDASANSGAPAAAGKPAGYVFSAQGTQHVVYRGVDNHIHELYWDANGWHHTDASGNAGAPNSVGDPTGYVFDAQGTQHVMYRAADNHIHELWWDSAGWHHHDPTGDNGAPNAAGDPSGYVFAAQGTQHVVYRGIDGRLIELWWRAGAWNHTDASYDARTVPPTGPVALHVTHVGDLEIGVGWTDRSDNEAGFLVRYDGKRTEFSDDTGMVQVGPNQVTATLTGLSSAFDYAISVVAFNDGGNSLSSNTINVTTPARIITVTRGGSGSGTTMTVTGAGFTPGKLVDIIVTGNATFQQLDFSVTSGADGKFITTEPVPCVSGIALTVMAHEDDNPVPTTSNFVLTTCP